MKTEWLYAPYNYENGEREDLDESSFVQVSLPHANKILERHGGENFQAQIDSYRFVSWYRRHFTLDESHAGKQLFLEFEGVATVAEVYVNGRHAGTHKGAYTGFALDITELVRTDGSDNVLAVRVDSTKHGDIPPEGGNVDYCLFGGIVRDVHLVVKEKLYVDTLYVTTPGIAEGNSRVKVQAVVKNKSNTEKTAVVEAAVKNASGETVATGQTMVTVAAGSETDVQVETTKVADVILWDMENPYLYTTQIQVREDGICMDEAVVKTGFRSFYFTDNEKESAFVFNGNKTVLLGINRHEQWPWIGRAVNHKLQAADADLIKESGLNAVRCSHYPQSIAFLNRCDEIGLLVFEEAPGWQHIGDADWQEIYKTNVKEMILRDRNHPSVISWGVRVNESQDSHALYEETNALSKTLDPTRPTHASRRMEDYNDSECQEDIFCVNYTYPEKPKKTPFLITEHSMDWYEGDGFPDAPSKKALKFLDSFGRVLDYMYGNVFCAGGFGWSMFDYNNEVNYTRTGNTFYSGIYDIFRYPKPVAYLYRSQKNPEQEVVLYIANYWAKEPRENGAEDVLVLSNCEEVELFVNGISAGSCRPNTYTQIPHPAFTFSNVPYEDGELKAVGYIGGNAVAEFVRRTPESAARLLVTSDYESIAADGSDFTSVTAELVDINGTRLYYATNEVVISINGNGRFIGEETIHLEGGHTAFLVQSEYLKTGEVTCTVRLKEQENVQGACRISVI